MARFTVPEKLADLEKRIAARKERIANLEDGLAEKVAQLQRQITRLQENAAAAIIESKERLAEMEAEAAALRKQTHDAVNIHLADGARTFCGLRTAEARTAEARLVTCTMCTRKAAERAQALAEAYGGGHA
jgi:uncharacterized coiled-coil protein SlyX